MTKVSQYLVRSFALVRRAHAPALPSFPLHVRVRVFDAFGVTDEPLEDGGQDEQQAEATAQGREGTRDLLRGQTRRQGGQQIEAKSPYARNEANVLSA